MGMGGNRNGNGFMGMGGNGNRNSPSRTPLLCDCKFGYSSHLISFSDLIKSCSEDLSENAHKSNYCLHELFSSYVHRLESLRPRGHDLMLPACTGYLHKQSFIIRSLFEFFSFFTLLPFRFLFRSLEFVRLSHSLLKYCATVLLCQLSATS